MAQDFVGSNNMNLLEPSGQFGTRLAGGADAASPRYIFTHLSPFARYLFPEEDDILLEYLEDDGQIIEPRYFCPIIPLVLVNGSQGIGSGWSTFIPPHNPLVVLDYIRGKLENRPNLPSIEPYVRGFKGEISRHDNGTCFVSSGRIRELNASAVLIDELPIGVWTNKYKEQLLKLQRKGLITDFVEDHTTTKVSFKVKLKSMQLKRMKQSGLEKSFGLKSNLRITNMNAFDENGAIQKFASAESIADAYFPTRLDLYHDRKSALLSEMEYASTVQRNKARFIKAVSNGEIDLIGGRNSRDELAAMLQNFDFDSSHDLDVIRRKNTVADSTNTQSEDDEEEDGGSLEDGSVVHNASGFDYLLKMPLSSLTTERIEGLNLDADKTEKEVAELRSKTAEELWMSDLEKLAGQL